jgi:hypothetical protein
MNARKNKKYIALRLLFAACLNLPPDYFQLLLFFIFIRRQTGLSCTQR